MRLPEHVTNNIRKNFGKDKKACYVSLTLYS